MCGDYVLWKRVLQQNQAMTDCGKKAVEHLTLSIGLFSVIFALCDWHCSSGSPEAALSFASLEAAAV
jgi:hypothetical protein